MTITAVTPELSANRTLTRRDSRGRKLETVFFAADGSLINCQRFAADGSLALDAAPVRVATVADMASVIRGYNRLR
jgi:hypothetical protein